MRSIKVQQIASSFHLNTSSNCFSYLIPSLDEIITAFAFSSSKKVYLSVDGMMQDRGVNGPDTRVTNGELGKGWPRESK